MSKPSLQELEWASMRNDCDKFLASYLDKHPNADSITILFNCIYSEIINTLYNMGIEPEEINSILRSKLEHFLDLASKTIYKRERIT